MYSAIKPLNCPRQAFEPPMRQAASFCTTHAVATSKLYYDHMNVCKHELIVQRRLSIG